MSYRDSALPGKRFSDPDPDPTKKDSFQAVLAWDSSRTFACFFYPAGGIDWIQSTTMTKPAAVVRSACLDELWRASHARTSTASQPAGDSRTG